MTKEYKNTSGTAISVPLVATGDVADQQIVEVADDVVMPPEYFELQEG